MRHKMVAGNWKMHGSVAFTQEMMTGLVNKVALVDKVTMLVCPPLPYLAQAVSLAGQSGIYVGAQTLVDITGPGAYTGEVAGFMLTDIGCHHVIVGHSERRALYGETNEIVAQKVKAALDSGLTPILCVGETLTQRESDITEQVISAQLDAVDAVIGKLEEGWSSLIIAYEPVWAIGTGKTATPEQAQAVHAFIRAYLSAKDSVMAEQKTILYGGSVKPDNAGAIFGQADVDGGLIGGAALNVDDFIRIYTAANMG
jgi:triosephosphate isomerase